MTNQEQYELICEKAKKYDRLVDVLDKLRDEIGHLHDWAFSREEILRIIDKYRNEVSEE